MAIDIQNKSLAYVLSYKKALHIQSLSKPETFTETLRLWRNTVSVKKL